ncbi:MAG TPA: M56 family metallopeptidase [Thermoanaerobaculia bacterium]|nr:M56 family metallopeptidase [Thermoanaerobaculia bacterium]
MNASSLAADLIAWSLQSALLLGLGLLLPVLFRLREPRACLAYAQGLLLAVLLLPVLQILQPQTGMAAFAGEVTVAGGWLGQLPDTEGPWSLPRLLLLAVGLGAALRLAWLGFGLIVLHAWRRGARPMELMELAPEVAEVVGKVGVRACLLVSPRVESPVTFGWRRPAVLVPEGFPDLPAEAQRGIVCHELLHVRRRDWLFALWEEGVRALLWFHPAVWMLLSRIALHREQVVDREAVRLTGSRRAYLEALRAVAFHSRQIAVPGLPFFHRGHLRERVVQLCKEVPMSRSRVVTLVSSFAGLLAVAAVLGIFAFPMSGTAWAAEPLKVEGDVQRPQAIHTVPTVYPAEARKDRIEGTTIVKAVIDEQGEVQDPVIEKSSGTPSLDQAAIDAVSQWKFKPATLHGEKVAVEYHLTFNFTLDEK